MVSREIWEKHALVSFQKCTNYIFEKLTRACFPRIALETILLPTLRVGLIGHQFKGNFISDFKN